MGAPASSWRALVRHMGPLFVLRGPDSSWGALVRPAGPWSVTRALIRPAGPDPSRGARVRYAEPWCFPQGPDPSHGALKPDRKSTSSRGPSGSRGPNSGFGAKYMLAPGDWPLGDGSNAPPPGTATGCGATVPSVPRFLRPWHRRLTC